MKNPQLLLVTHYCIRTRQVKHYRLDVACLGQEFNYTPERGRFKTRGDSLVAVLKTILPILIKLNNYCKLHTQNVHPESVQLPKLSILYSTTYMPDMMSTTPWKLNLRQVTIVAPRVAQRIPRRNPRDPRLPSYRPPSPTKFTGKPIEIPLEYLPVLEAKKPVRKFGTERMTKVARLNSFIYLTRCSKLTIVITIKGAKKAPNMGQIMAQMTEIHAPSVPLRKLVGVFVKADKKPKGSVNVPATRRRPQDPRRQPLPRRASWLPPLPPLSDSSKVRLKSNQIKAKIFSLTDSEISEVENSNISKKNTS